MTAIIDYGAGNLTSVKYAFAALGAETTVVRDAAAIAVADRVVFPGVGAAGSAMANLRQLGLVDAVRQAAASGKPFLGICLGMQILFEHSEEDGGTDTLGILPGQVRRFPNIAGFKVPEIGWNVVSEKREASSEKCGGLVSEKREVSSEKFGGLNGKEYYFVHSYYAEVGANTIGTTEYAGVTFTSAVKRGALVAYQFHPEKSGRVGLELIREWLCSASE